MTDQPVRKQRRYKNPYSIVRAAKRLIDTGHWGKGMWVKTANGVLYDESAALEMKAADGGGVCKVCLEGALALCSASHGAYDDAVELVQKEIPSHAALFEFNDSQFGVGPVSEVLEKVLDNK